MNRIASIAAAIVAAAAAVASPNAAAESQVADSFERMLAHQPHRGLTATTVQAERDPLVTAVALPLLRQTSVAPRLAAAAPDPIAASFERMLGHQPHQGLTATTVQAERDPLIAAIVLPLLREQVGLQVAAAR